MKLENDKEVKQITDAKDYSRVVDEPDKKGSIVNVDYLKPSPRTIGGGTIET